jgi:polysaccharide biosynthesis/export protein
MSKGTNGLGSRLWALLLILAVTTPHLVMAQAAAPAAASSQKVVPDDYRIGPGDVLRIVVARLPDYSAEVPVRPDGKITTPSVEDMVVIGKTPSQLARDMEAALAEVILTPEVSVIVTNAASMSSKIQVVGEVRRPQGMPFSQGMRVLDAILAADGLTEFAAPNKTKILRTIDGKETEIKVKLGDLMHKGKMKENVELRPGDIVIIDESWF